MNNDIWKSLGDFEWSDPIRVRRPVFDCGLLGSFVVLIYVGSRGLRDFDSALIGYAVATLFAIAALTYRYTC